MGKFLLRFFILILVVIFTFTLYLSFFGIETDKFDTLIKERGKNTVATGL